MVRQSAFETEGSFLKGCLHCHTTRSDGKGTPEEVIKKFVDNGYQFLAITDHRNYNVKNFTDLPLTIIPGMEINTRMNDDAFIHVFHIVCLGDPATTGFSQDETVPSFTSKDQFDFQPILDEMHAKNQMTIYCHPEWSATPAADFMRMKGNFAMEIWNSGCAIENHQDMNASYWDELLWDGQHIWGVATDDGHKMKHHCCGWVMVKSENHVTAILDALKKGCFYSSCGPEIYDFCYDEKTETVSLKCSEVAYIEFYCWGIPTRVVKAENGLIKHGEWLVPQRAKYVRGCVVDENGKRAWTNPIFLKG